MRRIIIFGNSSSGKSTLAKRLAMKYSLDHLDLDTIAWKKSKTPERMSIGMSEIILKKFISTSNSWVIEGCYSDLIDLVLDESTEIIYMKLPIQLCILNAQKRPWEPHKYPSKKDQDKNLDMLINWISEYSTRTDTFSEFAHDQIFMNYQCKKNIIKSNEHLEEYDNLL